MEDRYVTFEEYAKAVKLAIENIVHDNTMTGKDAVEVIYATPPAAFAKWKAKPINGEKPGPLISFYLSAIEMEPSEQLGGYASIWLNGDFKERYKAPLIARLSYTTTIDAVTESEGDLLQAQLMMAMPFNRPYATMVNGQWATMEAKECQNLTTIEIEADGDKDSKRQMNIEIPRAYFEYPIQVNDRFIKDINSHIFSIEQQNSIIKRGRK